MIAFAMACNADGGGSGGPVVLNVSGSWSGTVTLPASSPATMSIGQSGNEVSGQMSVAALFPQGLPLLGEVKSSAGTLTWVVVRGCDRWGGIMNLNSAGNQMTGALTIDRAGCSPAQPNGSGTVTMIKG
jgi:hypothetical protein